MPGSTPSTARYVSVARASAIAQLARRTLSRAITAKRLHAYRIGRLLRIDVAELQRWIEANGAAAPPKIKLLKVTDALQPYPLSWDEQAQLFQALPAHLARMALFKVNTGCRDQEVCGLRWEWEVAVPELDTSVFLIPGAKVKNGDERLVVLNRVARSVIESVRGQHPQFVFVYRGHPIETMHNNGWQQARVRAGLPQVRVHDLKHTFGRRLRAAGVSFEDRQDLLGHRSGRITTHYSAAELQNLIAAAEKVCELGVRKMPTLVVLKRRAPAATAASA